MIAEHLSNNSFQHDPVYDIHNREYIDDLIQVLILYELFKNAENAMSATKASAKMVLSTNISIDSIRKYPNNIDIPNEFYNLVEAFYYSILREREGLDGKYPLSHCISPIKLVNEKLILASGEYYMEKRPLSDDTVRGESELLLDLGLIDDDSLADQGEKITKTITHDQITSLTIDVESSADNLTN
ncbi:8157_t:CDS:2 [Funneliformis caledonium]|uniref:8157_t:CDS:1 n=1 Tax=Funneliformis caledonium TaxID=1117310 RepID=A0A9N9E298_9GLOM|nr:8157_t:CDS:2 [Funneliformis caledonium]